MQILTGFLFSSEKQDPQATKTNQPAHDATALCYVTTLITQGAHQLAVIFLFSTVVTNVYPISHNRYARLRVVLSIFRSKGGLAEGTLLARNSSTANLRGKYHKRDIKQFHNFFIV